MIVKTGTMLKACLRPITWLSLVVILMPSCPLATDSKHDLLIEAAMQADTKQFLSNASALETAEPELLLEILAQALVSHADDIAAELLDRGLMINARDEQGLTPLIYSVRYNSQNTVKLLMKKGADLQERDKKGLSLLHYAAAFGDSEMVAFLLHAGLDIHDMTELGAPIHSACKNNYNADRIISLLISEGADIESTGKNGFTPYLFSIALGNQMAAKTLKEAGADTSVASKDGSTAFTLAIKFAHKELLSAMLAQGEVTGSPAAIEQAVDLLAEQLEQGGMSTDPSKILDILELLHKADIANHFIKKYSEPIAKQAFQLNETAAIDFALALLGKEAKAFDHKVDLLVTAISNDNASAVQKLIQHGVETDPINSEFKHPLIAAAEYAGVKTLSTLIGSYPNLTKQPEKYFDALDIIARRGDIDMMSTMTLSKLRDGNITQADLLGPMMIAVEKNSIELTTYFLDLGVDINTPDRHGHTPLSVAAKEGYYDLSKLLIDRGALDRPSESSSSAFERSISANHYEISELIFNRLELDFSKESLEYAFLGALGHDNSRGLLLLLKAGLQPSHQIQLMDTDASALSLLFLSLEKKCPNVARLLMERGAEINPKMGPSVTHLGQAIDSGYGDLARELIERGADVDAIYSRNGGMSGPSVPPLIGALMMKDKDLAMYLLDKGADPNVKDSQTHTALFYADDDQLAQHLIKAGALVNTKDATGRTPLLNAVLSANVRLVNTLLGAGADPNKGVDSYYIHEEYGNVTPLIGSLVLLAEGSLDTEGQNIFRALLDHHADVNLDYSRRLRKPLDWAIELGLPNIAKVLQQRGAVRRCYKGKVKYAETDMACDW